MLRWEYPITTNLDFAEWSSVLAQVAPMDLKEEYGAAASLVGLGPWDGSCPEESSVVVKSAPM